MSAKDSIFDENGPGLADFLPDTSSGYTAYAGESLNDPAPVDEADIIEALKTVKDPEIPVNIYDLGLIYTIDCTPSGDVHIEMSLTAPAVLWQARCRNRWPMRSPHWQQLAVYR